jgi:probable HAF family extracellular repeat protein
MQSRARDAIFALASALACSTAAAAPVYSAIDIAAVAGGGGNSRTTAISDSGYVTGVIGSRGFLFDPHSMSMVLIESITSNPNTIATGVNSAGVVSGWILGSEIRSFIWSEKEEMQLTPLQFAMGINSAGIVVGFVPFPHAAVWDNKNGLTLLEELPTAKDGTVAYAVNNAGSVAGATQTAAGYRATVWRDGTPIDLGLIDGAVASTATGISANGVVVGYSNFGSTNRGTVWNEGLIIDVGNLPDKESGFLAGINARGFAVGSSCNDVIRLDTDCAAVVWNSSGGLLDLNDLVDLGPDWYLTSASGINDRGQIVATAFNRYDESLQHAFLLTPIRAVPEPGATALLILGLIGVSFTRRRED